MARVLIIGYGNPFRSDDGLGWQIANELSRTNRSAETEVLPCHQLTPELA
jgi:hydrogenase maturation protease